MILKKRRAWNKGLKKEDHPSLMEGALKRTGMKRTEKSKQKMSLVHMNKFYPDRQCIKCLKILHIHQFYKDAHNSRGFSYLCKNCQKEKNNKYEWKKILWKERSNNYYHNHKMDGKASARRKVYWAIKSGNLIKGFCQYPIGRCGGRIESHHFDYAQPLNVLWFCRKHHTLADKVQKTAENEGITINPDLCKI